VKNYKANPNQLTDLNSYTDGDGKLVRNVLPHTRSKPDFTTVPYLKLDDKIALQEIIPCSPTERIKLTVEYWDDDNNIYKTGDFYIPDIEYPYIDATDTDIIYDSIRFAFIEY
jgi:hypothetical protein